MDLQEFRELDTPDTLPGLHFPSCLGVLPIVHNHCVHRVFLFQRLRSDYDVIAGISGDIAVVYVALVLKIYQVIEIENVKRTWN